MENRVHGGWSEEESKEHINVLELRAILFGLKCLTKNREGVHVLILSDNTTAVASVNKMGSVRSSLCDKETRKIWFYAFPKNIWITASYLPGIENDKADFESRKDNFDNKEWKLNKSTFSTLMHTLDLKPSIDLFASRLNYQIKPFVSYGPDPEANHINAFTLDWGRWPFLYLFPPLISYLES